MMKKVIHGNWNKEQEAEKKIAALIEAVQTGDKTKLDAVTDKKKE